MFRRATPCFVMQREGRRECNAERGSARMEAKGREIFRRGAWQSRIRSNLMRASLQAKLQRVVVVKP